MLFDETVTGLGRAVRWAYGGDVVQLVVDKPLGSATKDPKIIRHCKQHSLVWVLADTGASREPDKVHLLRTHKVSGWWLRAERHRKFGKKEMLWVVARDIDRVIEIVEAAGGEPVWIVSRQGRKASTIVLRPSRRAKRRPAPRRPRKPRVAPAHAPLFKDE